LVVDRVVVAAAACGGGGSSNPNRPVSAAVFGAVTFQSDPVSNAIVAFSATEVSLSSVVHKGVALLSIIFRGHHSSVLVERFAAHSTTVLPVAPQRYSILVEKTR
jgi:hypothetical protein